ncbi:murein biosynthesis integral membrane protein MurJ [Bradyrhizobium sp. USDA 4452]
MTRINCYRCHLGDESSGSSARFCSMASSPAQPSPDQTRVIGIASLLWAASIFLSRVMGLIREQIIGRTLGASRQADLYFASFTLPDFLNYLLAAGALSIVFIPIFLHHVRKGDDEGAWHSFSVIANFVVVIGTIGIGVLMVFARPLAALIAPGFTEAVEIDTLVRLTRIILPAQFFHVVGGLLSAALQAQNLHALPAMAPLVYSAFIIIGGLVGSYCPGLGGEGFAWGVLAGSIVGPFGLPLYGCLKNRMRWRPVLSLHDADLRRYACLSLPIMIGFSIVVVDEWIVKNQASYLQAGALSYLQYGRTLMKVPIGIFGTAAGVASYPTISALVAEGRIAQGYALLCRAMRLMLALTFAAQVCLTVAGFEAVYLIWGPFANRFSAVDARQTAEVLGFLCLGLGGWAAQTIISRGFYALGNTWLPTLVGTGVAVAMTPLYVILRQQCGATGLAIASSISITVYVLLLGWLQRRRFEHELAATRESLQESGMCSAALRMAVAAALAIGLCLLARAELLQWLPGTHMAGVILRAALLCAFGITVYVGATLLLGVRDIADLRHVLLQKLWRQVEPVTAEPLRRGQRIK